MGQYEHLLFTIVEIRLEMQLLLPNLLSTVRRPRGDFAAQQAGHGTCQCQPQSRLCRIRQCRRENIGKWVHGGGFRSLPMPLRHLASRHHLLKLTSRLLCNLCRPRLAGRGFGTMINCLRGSRCCTALLRGERCSTKEFHSFVHAFA